jgi:hypothetical protein
LGHAKKISQFESVRDVCVKGEEISLITYIPLVTTVISAALTTLLWIQYRRRRKLHQLVWAVAMVLFTLGALLEFLMNPGIIGPSVVTIKMYYLTVGPQVSLLGTGVVLLMFPKWGRRALAIVIALSAILIGLGAMASIDVSQVAASFQSSVVFGISALDQSFPPSVRLITEGLNAYGAIALIGGSLVSFLLDRRRTYTLLIVLGGLLNAIGGILLGIFNSPDLFLEFELLGAIALFAGFFMSYRLRR